MDLTGGLAAEVGKLPAELQPVILALMNRVDELEAQAARDATAIADKVIAALVPQAQAMTQTVNAVADQAMTLIRRLDGASMTMKLGPETPA